MKTNSNKHNIITSQDRVQSIPVTNSIVQMKIENRESKQKQKSLRSDQVQHLQLAGHPYSTVDFRRGTRQDLTPRNQGGNTGKGIWGQLHDHTNTKLPECVVFSVQALVNVCGVQKMLSAFKNNTCYMIIQRVLLEFSLGKLACEVYHCNHRPVHQGRGISLSFDMTCKTQIYRTVSHRRVFHLCSLDKSIV